MLNWGIRLSTICLVAACNPVNRPVGPTALNSGYNDEQPALSGNGRFVAFVSNRNGTHQIWLYDLQLRQFADLPRLSRPDAIAENPSLSYTGRYIVYIVSDQGRPVIQLYDRIAQRGESLTMSYPGWVRNPSISPDGRYVVFESDRRGQWDVEVLDRGANIELDRPDGRVSK